jgi:hypothetical protein
MRATHVNDSGGNCELRSLSRSDAERKIPTPQSIRRLRRCSHPTPKHREMGHFGDVLTVVPRPVLEQHRHGDSAHPDSSSSFQVLGLHRAKARNRAGSGGSEVFQSGCDRLDVVVPLACEHGTVDSGNSGRRPVRMPMIRTSYPSTSISRRWRRFSRRENSCGDGRKERSSSQRPAMSSRTRFGVCSR